jgi:succinyl-diaminopimelate desuccinylase
MNLMKSIFDRIDGYRDEFIRLQGELTSRVALGPDNGGTGEHEKADYLRRLLASLEPDAIEEICAPDTRAARGHRPNLVATWRGPEGKARVWVLSHMDIVPPGDLSLWETDPYAIRVEGDRIYGRGVEDNQHGIVSSFLALRAVLETGQALGRPVGLALVADEETGSDYGLNYLLKTRREIFQQEDLILVPDGGNEEGTMIEVAEKSMLWVKFTILGRQCHASTPAKGENSLVGAAKTILALGVLKDVFPETDALFRPPESTFAPTKMEPNVPNVNTIPGRDVFYLDCRILPVHTTEAVLAECRRIAEDVARDGGFSVAVEATHRQDAPPPTSPEAAVVKALKAEIKNVTGREASPMGIGGGTVAAFFRKVGLPSAVWSTVSDTAHQPNEYCLLSNLITDAKIFASLYMNAA